MSKPLSAAHWRRFVREDWTRAAEAWERWEPSIMHSLAAVDPILLRSLELEPGHRVLDFGCGLGDPALAVAQWIAPRGAVLALDVSSTMLAVARRRARSRGIRNIRFRRGDIARFDPHGARFDRVVARFGLMFADDVPRTLANIRKALKPGGRMALAVWAERARNPYFEISAAAVRPFLTEPLPDPERSPHPMRFGRRPLLPRLLRQAGFRRVKVREVEIPFVYADAEDFATSVLEISSSLRSLMQPLSRADRGRVVTRLIRGARRYRDGGVVRIPALARVVSVER